MTGLLYWQTVYWHGNFPKAAGEPRYPAVPWNMEQTATYREFKVNGDGWLLYPGPKGEPLSSVRLENIRDGIEDYEYLALLRERVADVRKRKGVAKSLMDAAERELAVDEQVTRDWTRYTTDPEAIAAARERIAELIERLGSGK